MASDGPGHAVTHVRGNEEDTFIRRLYESISLSVQMRNGTHTRSRELQQSQTSKNKLSLSDPMNAKEERPDEGKKTIERTVSTPSSSSSCVVEPHE